MRVRTVHVLLPCLLAALLGARDARAEEVAAATREAFLRERDLTRLLAALEPGGTRSTEHVRRLARVALGQPVPPAPAAPGPAGVEGLPYAVQALRAGDLDAARARAVRVDQGGGLAGAWLSALVRLRGGDDAGAVGRLLAPPLIDWERDAFGLALLGAALPAEDRHMLAAGGQIALERAAERGRIPGIVAVARALAALDPEAGRRAHAFALEALRRAGEIDEARALLANAPAAGVAPGDPLLALQAALLAWEGGEEARVPGLLAGRPPPGVQSVWFALRSAGTRARTLPLGRPLGHRTGARAVAVVAARLASALGRPVSAPEVERWCREQRLDLAHAGTLRAFLEARGLHVLSIAGDPRPGQVLLEAGIPCVLLRLGRNGDDYADAPALVKGFDRRTGLWLLDEPDVRRLDVMPRAAAAKARLLCVVPPTRRALLAPFEGTAPARAGRLLERALDLSDRGQVAQAVPDVGAALPDAGGVVDLYRAHVLRRRAARTEGDAIWKRVREALERSRRATPMLGVEEHWRGMALAVEGRREEALGAFDRVAYLDGLSAPLALARFEVEQARGNRAAALTALDAAQRLAPLDMRVLYFRGTLRIALGETEAGRADLRRALDRRPGAVRVAVALAALERAAGRPRAALDLLDETARRERALADDPVLRSARRRAEVALIERATSVEELRPAMRSAEPTTRRRLVFALAERASEGDAAEALLRTLLADPDADVRVTTLRIYLRPWLRRRVESDAVLARLVTRMLEQDPEAGVRAAAAALLGRVRSPLSCRALTAAVGGAGRDASSSVRGAAARALGGHAVEACRDVLVAALEDEEAAVRRAAIETLFELTGTTRDYEPEAPAAERARAVAAWRAWLAGN